MDMGWRRKWACAGSAAVFLFAVGLKALGQQPKAAEPKKDAAAAAYVGSDACKACHKELSDSWASGAHGKALSAPGLADGLKGCEACHGPGGGHAADPAAVKPADPRTARPTDVADLCGKCHFEGQPNAAKGAAIQPKHWRRSEHSRSGLSCLACHTAHTQSDKSLSKQAPELCTGCHKDVMKAEGYVHKPVAGGACLTCHNPHGTNARHQLALDIRKVCASCHSPKTDTFTAAHKGYDVSASDCTECHVAHSTDRAAKLLKPRQHTPFKSGQCQSCHKPDSLELAKPQKELCASCHSKDLVQPRTDGKLVHAPAAEGICTSCHSAHASDAPKGLFKDKTLAYSCFLCHSKVEASVDAAYPHKPAYEMNCTVCHTGHVSSYKSLLVKESIDVCQTCHKPHLHPCGKTPEGKVVVDPTTKEMLTCVSCHTPHGSGYDKLTKKEKNAALCLMCHKV